MNTIIVYYSNTHNNEMIALHLQKKVGCDILKIEEVKRRTGLTILLDILFNRNPILKNHTIPLEYYDHFIFVAPIWAGKVASPLKAFMRKEKNLIKSYSFITLCGGVKGQKDKIRKEVAIVLEQIPKVVEELWISRLPGMTTMTSNYRVSSVDLEYFEETVDQFVKAQPKLSEVV